MAPEVESNGHAPSLTQADEMSLADAQAIVDEDAVPDTLEVRSDAVSVMRNSVAPMRRPLMIAAAVVGAVVVIVLVSGALGRGARAADLPVAE